MLLSAELLSLSAPRGRKTMRHQKTERKGRQKKTGGKENRQLSAKRKNFLSTPFLLPPSAKRERSLSGLPSIIWSLKQARLIRGMVERGREREDG